MKRTGIVLAVMILTVAMTHGEELKIGSIAPDFTAVASDGSHVHLTEWLNRAPIVLYFYPKDDSPGCTKEACGFRDRFAAFHDLKATIFGVSYDSVQSHKDFIQKHHLPFLLLTDIDRSISKSYGADGLFAAKRQTFVIDKKGVIVYINRFVKLSTQSLELQNFLAQL